MYGLCADTHFHNWSLFSNIDEDGENSRLRAMLQEFRRLCEATKKAGGKRVYLAGDTFHVRGSIKPSVMNPVVSEFIDCATIYDLQIRIMPGNHDLEGAEVTWTGNSTIPMSHSTCDDEPEVTVIQEPTFFEDDMVAMIPWQNTRAGLQAAIAEMQNQITSEGHDVSDVDLHLHTGINGVIIGMPDHGYAPEELAKTGFKRVFCGHYHNHKVFEVDDCKVVSIGALTHQTWGDVSTIAGWILVEGNDFEQFEAKTPKFMDLDDSYEIEDYAGNYVRVRGIQLDEGEIRELKNTLEEAGAKGVVVHAVAKSKVTTRSGNSAGKAVRMEQSINDWVSSNDDIPKTKSEAVARRALDVLSKARSVA